MLPSVVFSLKVRNYSPQLSWQDLTGSTSYPQFLFKKNNLTVNGNIIKKKKLEVCRVAKFWKLLGFYSKTFAPCTFIGLLWIKCLVNLKQGIYCRQNKNRNWKQFLAFIKYRPEKYYFILLDCGKLYAW